MVEKYGKEKEAVYRKWCLQKPEEFHLAPGAAELLDYIKENNIPHTIATMSEWDNVEFYIKEFHLEKWFDIDKIVYSDGSIPGKPAPDIFLIAAEKIGLKPEECVVVEDAIAGINSAKNANIGKIIAIASLEPVDFYKQMEGIFQIIKNFHEFDKSILDVKSEKF
jgi:beta-phosphoglucomutase-like phosphatase (HAD superfamily)